MVIKNFYLRIRDEMKIILCVMVTFHVEIIAWIIVFAINIQLQSILRLSFELKLIRRQNKFLKQIIKENVLLLIFVVK